MHEIVISMGSHATTDNLKLNNGEFTVAFATAETMVASDFVGIVSANNDPEKMNFISYEPVNHKYIQMGKVIGDAFSCGKELK